MPFSTICIKVSSYEEYQNQTNYDKNSVNHLFVPLPFHFFDKNKNKKIKKCTEEYVSFYKKKARESVVTNELFINNDCYCPKVFS